MSLRRPSQRSGHSSSSFPSSFVSHDSTANTIHNSHNSSTDNPDNPDNPDNHSSSSSLSFTSRMTSRIHSSATPSTSTCTNIHQTRKRKKKRKLLSSDEDLEAKAKAKENENVHKKAGKFSEINFSLEEVISTSRLKSFDYRLLNLLMYRVTGLSLTLSLSLPLCVDSYIMLNKTLITLIIHSRSRL